jgi:putative ABC transport system permease protein
MPEVEAVAPYLSFSFFDWTIGGIDPSKTGFNVVTAKDLTEGRFLTSEDSNTILLDKEFATSRSIEVGDTIQITTRNLKVVGIVKSGSLSGPRYIRSHMYLTMSTAREVIKEASSFYVLKPVESLEPEEINVVITKCTDTRFLKEVAEKTTTLIGARATTVIPACGLGSAKTLPISEQNAWFVALISTVSATAIALKSQLAAVVERKREIGVLKAVGWSNTDILKQLSGESLIQALVGGVLGLLVGYSALVFVPVVLLLPDGVTLFLSNMSVFTSLAAVFVGGVFAGLFPAWKATRMKPAEALRSI